MKMEQWRRSKERKGNEMDVYGDFCDRIRSGYKLEQEINTCMGGCSLMSFFSEEDYDLEDFAMSFRADTYYCLRDRNDGKVIPTCIKYASYLVENYYDIIDRAEEMRGFCRKHNPNGIGEELSDTLEQSIMMFEEYASDAEEIIRHITEICNGETIPSDLCSMMQELDQEIMKECM